MKRPFQPEWASKEESRIADEWLKSGSKQPLEEYIPERASKRLLKEYERQDEIMKNMKFGHEVLPDGDIVVYN